MNRRMSFRCLSVLFVILAFTFTTAKAQESKSRPRIGISAALVENQTVVPQAYVSAVIDAGGVPLVLPLTTDPVLVDSMLAVIDGLVLTGGEDVSPALYKEDPHPKLELVVQARDDAEAVLIKKALAAKIPMLGICRGHQILNVLCGGSLYQDIPSQLDFRHVQHRQNNAQGDVSHAIKIDKSSILYSIFGKDSIFVVSHHHQAVKKVAPNTKVTATSSDGIVEAMQMTDRNNVLTVQWHPEVGYANGDQEMLKVFQWLVQQARTKRE
ncbi:MAG: gamma-glutamyl-gamma-aminobutyrate hydrolase family protein [Thermoguttaceae bacterium]|nr:gamma-glutamyl-gamma-aminobutyrate hydrolase family protein [Thermoguttaceae bacterium]